VGKARGEKKNTGKGERGFSKDAANLVGKSVMGKNAKSKKRKNLGGSRKKRILKRKQKSKELSKTRGLVKDGCNV